jgi:hypothetical protein
LRFPLVTAVSSESNAASSEDDRPNSSSSIG